MAPRLGFSHRELSKMHPAACADDPRLVWKAGDRCIVGIVLTAQRPIEPYIPAETDAVMYQLGGMNVRQMRLLAAQLNAHADAIEREDVQIEVVIP